MIRKRKRPSFRRKPESRVLDPIFDPARINVTNLKDGNLYAIQGCYRKKRLPNCP